MSEWIVRQTIESHRASNPGLHLRAARIGANLSTHALASHLGIRPTDVLHAENFGPRIALPWFEAIEEASQ